uniref:Amidohydrolase-related domain-containing protein n=1 Tax=Trieres chinensis TaxID=1514140 RepID=A0A7S1Z3V0_TRICV
MIPPSVGVRAPRPLLLTGLLASLYALNGRSSALTLKMSGSSAGPPAAATAPKVIDSHLHVWASSSEAAKSYPYAEGQDPPPSLIDRASTSELLKIMDDAGVDGALIVQPINHKYDHSYVTDAVRAHPDRLKGMLLHDPALPPERAVSRLEELTLDGYVGVRFNPYLWPEGAKMSEEGGCGLAVYKRCGELKMPVGVMCFKGLELHYDDIVRLIESSPDTALILDHLGFTGLDERGDAAFEQLLSLAKYPNVVVKVSALFRVAGPGSDPYPHNGVRTRRFVPLLEAFGADRLMFGTDFPYVLEQEGSYGGATGTVSSWATTESERASLMGGTAERLFGPWGSVGKSS